VSLKQDELSPLVRACQREGFFIGMFDATNLIGEMRARVVLYSDFSIFLTTASSAAWPVLEPNCLRLMSAPRKLGWVKAATWIGEGTPLKRQLGIKPPAVSMARNVLAFDQGASSGDNGATKDGTQVPRVSVARGF
jgi:hypothetical protein